MSKSLTKMITEPGIEFHNKKIVEIIITQIGKKNDESYLKYIAENIKWNIVGMPSISGKNEFLKAVETLELENFLSVNIKNVVAEGDYVVVESCEDKGKLNSFNNPAYCDIYRIKNGKLEELTTYVVDTTMSE